MPQDGVSSERVLSLIAQKSAQITELYSLKEEIEKRINALEYSRLELKALLAESTEEAPVPERECIPLKTSTSLHIDPGPSGKVPEWLVGRKITSVTLNAIPEDMLREANQSRRPQARKRRP